MTYDEALAKLQNIISEMEGEAISLDNYKKKLTEAKKLIAFCQKQLTGMEDELKDLL